MTTPRTIQMTLVPQNKDMLAEVWVSNQDVGFVRPGQDVKIKLRVYVSRLSPFSVRGPLASAAKYAVHAGFRGPVRAHDRE